MLNKKPSVKSLIAAGMFHYGVCLEVKANILAKLRNKLNDFKIGELTVTEIEECKTLWILHDQKFIIGKDNFTKVKNSLNLFYDDKKYITRENEDWWHRKFFIRQKSSAFIKERQLLYRVNCFKCPCSGFPQWCS